MKCSKCKNKINSPKGLDSENFTVYCSECVRNIYKEAYDFDKSQYRGLHAIPNAPEDEISNDPDKKRKHKIPKYNQTKDQAMKKTDKIIKKTKKKNSYDPGAANIKLRTPF